MSWLLDNMPLISGVVVAFLSFLSSFIKLLSERNIDAMGIKKLRAYADIYSLLPDNINDKDNIEKLLNQETERVFKQTSKHINIANIVLVIMVAILGGGLSYLFALWATSSDIMIFAILAWLLFAIVVIFTLGISIAGIASIYDEPKSRADVGSR